MRLLFFRVMDRKIPRIWCSLEARGWLPDVLGRVVPRGPGRAVTRSLSRILALALVRSLPPPASGWLTEVASHSVKHVPAISCGEHAF